MGITQGISGLKQKNRTFACVHGRYLLYYIKPFRKGADRHNGILMSLLLLAAETIITKFTTRDHSKTLTKTMT